MEENKKEFSEYFYDYKELLKEEKEYEKEYENSPEDANTQLEEIVKAVEENKKSIIDYNNQLKKINIRLKYIENDETKIDEQGNLFEQKSKIEALIKKAKEDDKDYIKETEKIIKNREQIDKEYEKTKIKKDEKKDEIKSKKEDLKKKVENSYNNRIKALEEKSDKIIKEKEKYKEQRATLEKIKIKDKSVKFAIEKLDKKIDELDTQIKNEKNKYASEIDDIKADKKTFDNLVKYIEKINPKNIDEFYNNHIQKFKKQIPTKEKTNSAEEQAATNSDETPEVISADEEQNIIYPSETPEAISADEEQNIIYPSETPEAISTDEEQNIINPSDTPESTNSNKIKEKEFSIKYEAGVNKYYIYNGNNVEDIFSGNTYALGTVKEMKKTMMETFGEDVYNSIFNLGKLKNRQVLRKCDPNILGYLVGKYKNASEQGKSELAEEKMGYINNYILALSNRKANKDSIPFDLEYNLEGLYNCKENNFSNMQKRKFSRMAKLHNRIANIVNYRKRKNPVNEEEIKLLPAETETNNFHEQVKTNAEPESNIYQTQTQAQELNIHQTQTQAQESIQEDREY